jgi:hypothetical protein
MNLTIFGVDVILLVARQTMLERLDPPTRARVLMALLGLVILGFGMMLLAWLGARFARRYRQGRGKPGPSEESPQLNKDAWWKKPVSADLDASRADDDTA